MNNMYKEDSWCGCKERKMRVISRHVLAGGLTLLAIMFLVLFGGTPQVNAEQTAQTTEQRVKMTNAAVIQLVTAGLSEQVVITSIRQAPERDFDLTATGLIALKKAGVPDAVILIMQNGATPVKPAAPSDDKGPKDDTVSGIKDYLQQRVTSESRGALTLSSFSKVNGYEQELTKMYVLEWQAEIQFQQEGWKPGDAIGGYWNDFGVMPAKTGFLTGSWQHFRKGTKVRLKGDCMLRRTEQGWRIEELTIKTYQVIAESDPTVRSPKQSAGGAGTRSRSEMCVVRGGATNLVTELFPTRDRIDADRIEKEFQMAHCIGKSDLKCSCFLGNLDDNTGLMKMRSNILTGGGKSIDWKPGGQ